MRIKQRIGLCVAALLGGLILGPATPAMAGGWQKVASAGNGECMEVAHEDGNGNGAQVRQWNCVGGDTQLWTFPASGRYTTVVNKWSGRCLQPTGGATSAGATMEVWSCNGSDEQQWEPGWNLEGSTKKMLRNKKSQLCVRVPTTGRIEGRLLDQQACDYTALLWWWI